MGQIAEDGAEFPGLLLEADSQADLACFLSKSENKEGNLAHLLAGGWRKNGQSLFSTFVMEYLQHIVPGQSTAHISGWQEEQKYG